MQLQDEKAYLKKLKKNVLRNRKNCHKKDIICADYSHNLGLIATGSRDHCVRIFDYERVKFEDEILVHTSEIVLVKFLTPFPILLTIDSTGQLYAWTVKPHPRPKTCLLQWRNLFNLVELNPISAIDSHYDEEKEQFLIIIGDEKGSVRVQDFYSVTKVDGMKPEDVVTGNTKRNAKR